MPIYRHEKTEPIIVDSDRKILRFVSQLFTTRMSKIDFLTSIYESIPQVQDDDMNTQVIHRFLTDVVWRVSRENWEYEKLYDFRQKFFPLVKEYYPQIFSHREFMRAFSAYLEAMTEYPIEESLRGMRIREYVRRRSIQKKSQEESASCTAANIANRIGRNAQ
ncbi:hypothetical protein LRY60_04210 [Candidatus Woesebacteria bacterium]|nr:hypothetical protein [Candidatus Woesebacteria bacterium]